MPARLAKDIRAPVSRTAKYNEAEPVEPSVPSLTQPTTPAQNALVRIREQASRMAECPQHARDALKAEIRESYREVDEASKEAVQKREEANTCEASATRHAGAVQAAEGEAATHEGSASAAADRAAVAAAKARPAGTSRLALVNLQKELNEERRDDLKARAKQSKAPDAELARIDALDDGDLQKSELIDLIIKLEIDPKEIDWRTVLGCSKAGLSSF